jgi:hypothetical protein
MMNGNLEKKYYFHCIIIQALRYSINKKILKTNSAKFLWEIWIYKTHIIYAIDNN